MNSNAILQVNIITIPHQQGECILIVKNIAKVQHFYKILSLQVQKSVFHKE